MKDEVTTETETDSPSRASPFPVWLERRLPKNRTARWALLLGGALLVNALGNPVWTYVLAPSLGASRDVLLDVATFGRESARSAIYKDIARAQSDMSLNVMAAPMFLLLTLIFQDIVLRWFTQFNEAERDASKGIREVEELEARLEATERGDREAVAPVQDEAENLAALRARLIRLRERWADLGRRNRKLRTWNIAFVCLIAIYLVFTVFDWARVVYVQSAIARYDQLRRINAPFLTPSEDAQLVSKFARVANRDDYLQVVRVLEQTAKRNGIDVGTMNPW